MTKSGRTLVAALATALLAGCKTVGPNFTPPAATTAATYLMKGDDAAMSPQARVAGAWWKAFGSPDLDRVMDEALAGNQTIVAANASLRRLQALAAATHGAQLPQVDALANIEEERINIAALGFPTFPNPTLGLYSIGAQVSYDADLFGGLRRATEAARATAESQARQADAAYLTLTGQTALAALQIATTRAEIAAAEQAASDDRSLIEVVRKAEAAGGEAPSATVSVRSQLASDEALLPPLRQQLSQARHSLAQLVGSAPADWTAPAFELASFRAPAAAPASLPSELVHRRPDILAAEATLHAATADVGVATAALYPDIKISGNFIQTALAGANLFTYAASGWQIGAGLTQPLFHGGTLKARKRAAEAQADVALAQYRNTVVTAFTQVADVMEAIKHDDDELAALGLAQQAAEAALHDDLAAFRLGGAALLPVLDDQRKVAIARRALVMAEGKRLADIAELYVATAADWRDAAT